MPNHERFVTLELPDSLAINPDRAGLLLNYSERLHTWQGVIVTIMADSVAAALWAAAMADMMTGLPPVAERLRVVSLSAEDLAAAFLAP